MMEVSDLENWSFSDSDDTETLFSSDEDTETNVNKFSDESDSDDPTLALTDKQLAYRDKIESFYSDFTSKIEKQTVKSVRRKNFIERSYEVPTITMNAGEECEANTQLLTSLIECAEVHNSNAAAYQRVYTELDSLKNQLNEALECIDFTWEDITEKIVREEPGDVNELLQDTLETYNSWWPRLDKLKERCADIVPVHNRITASAGKRPAESLCDYTGRNISLRAGERIVVLDSNDANDWLVINSRGKRGTIPAPCCLIPPPDRRALAKANRLTQNLLGHWRETVSKIRRVIQSGRTDASASKLKTIRHMKRSFLRLQQQLHKYHDLVSDSQDRDSPIPESESRYRRSSLSARDSEPEMMSEPEQRHVRSGVRSTVRGHSVRSIIERFSRNAGNERDSAPSHGPVRPRSASLRKRQSFDDDSSDDVSRNDVFRGAHSLRRERDKRTAANDYPNRKSSYTSSYNIRLRKDGPRKSSTGSVDSDARSVSSVMSSQTTPLSQESDSDTLSEGQGQGTTVSYSRRRIYTRSKSLPRAMPGDFMTKDRRENSVARTRTHSTHLGTEDGLLSATQNGELTTRDPWQTKLIHLNNSDNSETEASDIRSRGPALLNGGSVKQQQTLKFDRSGPDSFEPKRAVEVGNDSNGQVCRSAVQVDVSPIKGPSVSNVSAVTKDKKRPSGSSKTNEKKVKTSENSVPFNYASLVFVTTTNDSDDDTLVDDGTEIVSHNVSQFGNGTENAPALGQEVNANVVTMISNQRPHWTMSGNGTIDEQVATTNGDDPHSILVPNTSSVSGGGNVKMQSVRVDGQSENAASQLTASYEMQAQSMYFPSEIPKKNGLIHRAIDEPGMVLENYEIREQGMFFSDEDADVDSVPTVTSQSGCVGPDVKAKQENCVKGLERLTAKLRQDYGDGDSAVTPVVEEMCTEARIFQSNNAIAMEQISQALESCDDVQSATDSGYQEQCITYVNIEGMARKEPVGEGEGTVLVQYGNDKNTHDLDVESSDKDGIGQGIDLMDFSEAAIETTANMVVTRNETEREWYDTDQNVATLIDFNDSVENETVGDVTSDVAFRGVQQSRYLSDSGLLELDGVPTDSGTETTVISSEGVCGSALEIPMRKTVVVTNELDVDETEPDAVHTETVVIKTGRESGEVENPDTGFYVAEIDARVNMVEKGSFETQKQGDEFGTEMKLPMEEIQRGMVPTDNEDGYFTSETMPCDSQTYFESQRTFTSFQDSYTLSPSSPELLKNDENEFVEDHQLEAQIEEATVEEDMRIDEKVQRNDLDGQAYEVIEDDGTLVELVEGSLTSEQTLETIDVNHHADQTSAAESPPELCSNEPFVSRITINGATSEMIGETPTAFDDEESDFRPRASSMTSAAHVLYPGGARPKVRQSNQSGYGDIEADQTSILSPVRQFLTSSASGSFGMSPLMRARSMILQHEVVKAESLKEVDPTAKVDLSVADRVRQMMAEYERKKADAGISSRMRTKSLDRETILDRFGAESRQEESEFFTVQNMETRGRPRKRYVPESLKADADDNLEGTDSEDTVFDNETGSEEARSSSPSSAADMSERVSSGSFYRSRSLDRSAFRPFRFLDDDDETPRTVRRKGSLGGDGELPRPGFGLGGSYLSRSLSLDGSSFLQSVSAPPVEGYLARYGPYASKTSDESSFTSRSRSYSSSNISSVLHRTVDFSETSIMTVDEFANKYRIDYVVDPWGMNLSVAEAVQNDVINMEQGRYVNAITGASMTIETAIIKKLIVQRAFTLEDHRRMREERYSRRQTPTGSGSTTPQQLRSPLSSPGTLRRSFSTPAQEHLSSPAPSPASTLRRYTSNSNSPGGGSSSYGLIHFNSHTSGVPCSIKYVANPLLGQSMSFEVAKRCGIIDSTNRMFVDKKRGRRLTFDEAIEEGLMEVDNEADDVGGQGDDVRTSFRESFLIYGAMDQAQQKRLSLKEALSEGIIDSKNGTYRDSCTNESFPLYDAINSDYVRAKRVEGASLNFYNSIVDPSCVLEVQREGFTRVYVGSNQPGRIGLTPGLLNMTI